MGNDYIGTINNYISQILFYSFVGVLSVLSVLLIISLLFLIIGCLIKSQKIKSRFLKASLSLLVLLFFVILIPIIMQTFNKIV